MVIGWASNFCGISWSRITGNDTARHARMTNWYSSNSAISGKISAGRMYSAALTRMKSRKPNAYGAGPRRGRTSGAGSGTDVE